MLKIFNLFQFQEDKMTDFFHKVGETFLFRISTMVLTLIVSMIVARTLGPSGYGIYGTAIALGLLFVQFGHLGFGASNTYMSAKSKEYLPQLIGNSLVVALIAGSLIVSIMLLIFWLQPSWIPISGNLFYYSLLWIFPGLLVLFCQSILLGFQNFRTYNFIEIALRGVHIIFLGIAIGLGFNDLNSFFLIFLFSWYGASFYALYRLISLSQFRFPTPSLRLLRSLISYGGGAYMAALFSFLCLRFDLLMVKMLAGADNAGLYNIAKNLGDVVYSLPIIAGMVLFSQLSIPSDFNEKKLFLYRVIKIMSLVMLIIVLISGFFVIPLLPIVYGHAFKAAIQPFLYLLPGVFFLSLATLIQNFIASSGQTWIMLIGPISSFVINVPLNLILIPLYGPSGAAIGSTLSYGLWLIIAFIIILNLKDRKQGLEDIIPQSKDYILIPYPLSDESKKKIYERLGRELPVIEIASFVRKKSVREIYGAITRLNVNHLYVTSLDQSDKSFFYVLRFFSLLVNPRKLMIISAKKIEPLMRWQLILSVLIFTKTFLLNPLNIIRAKKTLRKMVFLERVELNPKTMDRFLFLQNNLWFGTKAGGSIGHIAGVLNGLRNLGHKVTCGALSKPLMIQDDIEFMTLPYERNLTYPIEINNYLYCQDLNKKLSKDPSLKGRFDLIYQRMSLGNFTGVFLSQVWKIPLILEYNGSEVWISMNWGKKLSFHGLADMCEKVCLRHAHIVVTVSDVLKKELIEKGVEEKRIVCYPNCVDQKLFDPSVYTKDQQLEVRERYGIHETDCLVTFIGTFGKWHGVNILAKAIKHLVENYQKKLEDHNVKFMLIGDGQEMSYVRNILEKPQMKPFVCLTGLIEQKKGPLYLATADIFVSPHVRNEDGSNFFGSPTKLFEYMAMGKPIIASDIEQLSEIFKGSPKYTQGLSPQSLDDAMALLVETNSYEDLAEALLFLLENRSFWKENGS